MKTIIKEGKKEFVATCSKCGCEFKYELSDIDINSVTCPCCNHYVTHPNQIINNTISWSETKRLIERIKNGSGLPPISELNINRKGFWKIK